MAGGLLNLVAVGSQNIILNGNPKTSFFKNVYKKYTNFGMQKFRIDYDGQRTLRYKEETVLDFKIPRYAELLMDTYVVVNLPNIWSPIIPPQDCSGTWLPYEFRWIENVGWHMIKEIEVYVGGQTLQKFSGEYMMNMMKRDFSGDKKELLAEMIGQSTELADPANFSNNKGYYPNAYYTPLQPGPDPSIRGRKLYIPINCWFTLTSRLSFPLVCLQYNELHIRVTFRPVKDLFQIRDIDNLVASGGEGGDFPNKFVQPPPGDLPLFMKSKYWGYPIQDIPLVAPDPNNPWHAFYRFLQPPPTSSITPQDYEELGTTKLEWNADVHLLSTYCFLSNDETRLFAASPQQYLIKEVRERTIHRVVGSYKVEMDSLGLVSDWMFFLRRSDANLRNEWNNYTNWEYPIIPQGPVSLVPSFGVAPMLGYGSATHWGSVSGSHVAAMDPNNIDYTGNILLRDKFYDGLVNGGVINPSDAATIITNPKTTPGAPAPLAPLYSPASTILARSDVAMLDGPNNNLLPGINPNGPSSSTTEGCQEAGNDESGSHDSWGGWSIGGMVPYPYAPIKVTGNYTSSNQKGILLSMAILLDGKYRENLFDQGVYNYVEKYMRTFSGSLSDNLFCYNFCINASYLHPTTALLPAQPTGAINMSKFNTIEWEINTYVPPLNPQAQTSVVCDGSGNIIGINKTDWEIYQYTYDLHIMEARYNMIIFEAGNCGLQYAR